MTEVLIHDSVPRKLLFRLSLTVVLEKTELLAPGWSSGDPGWRPGPAAGPQWE